MAIILGVITCEGGCIGGAGVLGEKNRAARTIQRFIGKEPGK